MDRGSEGRQTRTRSPEKCLRAPRWASREDIAVDPQGNHSAAPYSLSEWAETQLGAPPHRQTGLHPRPRPGPERPCVFLEDGRPLPRCWSAWQ
jgi:hypothetical protein